MLSPFKALPFLVLAAVASAQEAAPGYPPGYHRHDGFYLSLNPGIALGKTVIDGPGYRETAKGGASVVELRLGGAVRPNLILSGDFIVRTSRNPDVSPASSPLQSGDFRFTDGTLGLGLTYYFMPYNVYLSGTVGSGRILFLDVDNSTGSSSDGGLSLTLKAGKEWWVSKNWGLGVAGGYGFVSAKNGDFVSGTQLTSNKVFLLFSTTYN